MGTPNWIAWIFRYIAQPHRASAIKPNRDSNPDLGRPATALSYIRCDSPFLKQGEIIYNMYELQLQIPQATIATASQGTKFNPIEHPYAIVISQGCDLEQDHRARSGQTSSDKLLTHVLFCALFSQDEVRVRSKLTTDPMKRVRQNQDERYHYLSEAPIDGTETSLPELIADFKTTFSLPVDFVYWLISTEQATRKGALLSPYLEDFMHRLYSFLGRVATP